MRKLKIIMDGKEVTAELIDRNPKTAGAVWNALPIQSRINTWGDEIYFGTIVKIDEENAQEKVEIGDVRMTGYGMSNVAEGYTRKDMLDNAMEYTDKALKIFERLDEKRMLTQCHLNYGIIHRNRKEWNLAISHFKKAVRMAEESKDTEFLSQIHFEYGKLYRSKGEKNKAEEYFKRL